jgi:hypothetical protein
MAIDGLALRAIGGDGLALMAIDGLALRAIDGDCLALRAIDGLASLIALILPLTSSLRTDYRTSSSLLLPSHKVFTQTPGKVFL